MLRASVQAGICASQEKSVKDFDGRRWRRYTIVEGAPPLGI